MPTMTVNETFNFAFDSMSGGTHASMMEGNESMTDAQKDLMSWMDSKYFKVKSFCTDHIALPHVLVVYKYLSHKKLMVEQNQSTLASFIGVKHRASACRERRNTVPFTFRYRRELGLTRGN